MSQLVSYYEEDPLSTKGKVEIHQEPISSAAGLSSEEGAIRASLVYVRVPRPSGPDLVPFGEYDEWSLRDRYNEAIEIMNALGAATITCETFREVTGERMRPKAVENLAEDFAEARLGLHGNARHLPKTLSERGLL